MMLTINLSIYLPIYVQALLTLSSLGALEAALNKKSTAAAAATPASSNASSVSTK